MNTNSNSVDKAITHAFEQIEIALNQNLKRQGYKILKQQPEELNTANKSIIWISDIHALRLSWDANKNLFILERANELPLQSTGAWNEIVHTTFNPGQHDEHYIVTIASEFVDRLK